VVAHRQLADRLVDEQAAQLGRDVVEPPARVDDLERPVEAFELGGELVETAALLGALLERDDVARHRRAPFPFGLKIAHVAVP
jgi:hypothetical protein